MNEFNSRIAAQRTLLKIVNEPLWTEEPLYALSESCIGRWSIVNRLDPTSKFVRLLYEASTRIFEMANHSDDPICGEYRLSSSELVKIGEDLRSAGRPISQN
jgi:hypothetical protein